MALVEGQVSKLYVSEDGGTTFVPVAKRVDMTLNLNKGEIDASHMDTGGWSEYLEGRKDATIDFTCRYDEEDAGQGILIDNYFEGGTIKVKFLLKEEIGANEYVADGFVTSLSPAPSDGSPTDMSGSIRLTGVVTKSAQVQD